MARIVILVRSIVRANSTEIRERGIAVEVHRRIRSDALMIGAIQMHSNVQQRQFQSRPNRTVVAMAHAMATKTNRTVHSIVSSAVMECAMATRRLKVVPEIALAAMECVNTGNQGCVPKIVVEMALVMMEKTLSTVNKIANAFLQALRAVLIFNVAMDVTTTMVSMLVRANSTLGNTYHNLNLYINKDPTSETTRTTVHVLTVAMAGCVLLTAVYLGVGMITRATHM